MGRTILFLFALAIFSVLHSHGQATKCGKLFERKEWRTLTQDEKSGWAGAVKCLGSIRHQRLSFTPEQTVLEGMRSLYDDFSYSHAAVEHSAHRNVYFLPWHRWFLYLFDASLRQNCGYGGPTPYWDWSRDHADLVGSSVFEDSPEFGLGGTGDCSSSPEADCKVTTGAFAQLELAWPIPHPLRRNLTLITGWFDHEKPQNSTLGPDSVRNSTEHHTGDFYSFQHSMEQMHNHVHNFVGGDLAGDCPKKLPAESCKDLAVAFTPNDPLFWLHHAQLDRLWSKWQRRHPANFAAFSGIPFHSFNMSDPQYDVKASADYKMPFDVQSVPVTPRQVFDTEAGPLCYQYVDDE
ncbi:monooxygenase [Colletotrichum costaricense]|uniref:Monooxygenase n=1 Tax=Colletotrichum costaricense TaxID=1209916 RepID=A0AAJ0DY96_9PEZI|nr:monooxygenase [Colletotrichum costaricense]KAK1520758.1 monooxygenase [Colletotrichum costaricense]